MTTVYCENLPQVQLTPPRPYIGDGINCMSMEGYQDPSWARKRPLPPSDPQHNRTGTGSRNLGQLTDETVAALKEQYPHNTVTKHFTPK